MMEKLLSLLLLFVFAAGSAHADDDLAFDLSGYKKIPNDEALNQWAYEMQVGAFEARPSVVAASEWTNLYLAFAVEARYGRDCFGSKQSALCTFLRSAVRLSGNLTWSDSQSTDRYDVVLIPIEYVTGTFGKQGPDVKTTDGALFATVGIRSEVLRDLGLAIEGRILTSASASVNYSSGDQPLARNLGFRWIGSVRVFLGGSATDVAGLSARGAIAGGLETQIGLALDLRKGAVAFTNTTRHEGDLGFGDNSLRLAQNSDKIELKYLHSVCRGGKRGGCIAPRIMNLGGGVRYEYLSSSIEARDTPQGTLGRDQSIHRVIFFAEVARF